MLVGAGVIGLEMAGAFADLGSRVTVIGQTAEILPTLDHDVAAYIRKIQEAKGVTFQLAATVERFTGSPGVVTTHMPNPQPRPPRIGPPPAICCSLK